MTDKDPPKHPENKSLPQEPSVEEPASGSLERDKKHPPKDHPETHIDPGGAPSKTSFKKVSKGSYSRPILWIWSGEVADVANRDRGRHGWLTRKPEGTHSDGLGILDGQNERPCGCVLEGKRDLPRPRFCGGCLDASSVSLEYVDFILRHLVQQGHQELQQERLEREGGG